MTRTFSKIFGLGGLRVGWGYGAKDITDVLNSVRSQVKSAEIAYEGITADYERGSGRTTLEVIQSNTLLLNSQLSLASSERNYLLAQYNLLKFIGLLNSKYLKLQ